MSSNLDLNVINFQNNLRSKPHRDNFTDIENNFNELRTEVYASIASTASEVVSARNNFGNLSDNIQERKLFGNVIDGTGGYIVTNSSGLTVSITKGSGIVNGVGVYHNTSATGSVSIPSTAGFSRVDVVHINSDNSRTITTGTPTSGTASQPTSASTQMAVAKWKVYDTTGTISNITDLRYQNLRPFLNEDYMDANFTFSGNTISNVLLTDVDKNTRTYDFSFSGSTISTVGTTIYNKRFVHTFTFSGGTASHQAYN
jgi:hypothetical protein